jgi:hypothetical protein
MKPKPRQSRLLSAAIAIPLISGCASQKFAYPDPEISVPNLRETVGFLCAVNPPRCYEHPDSLLKAADYIKKRFQDHGLRPELQEFQVEGNRYVNVVASAGPQTGSRLIVGAHYDVCGSQPGADDNASAVAGLLEIARFARQHDAELPFGIDFVAYTLEEPPNFASRRMGSHVHAESLHRQKIAVRGMICLEMIGYFSDRKKSQEYPLSMLKWFYPTTGNFIAVVGNYGSSSLMKQTARHLGATAIPVETLRAPAFLQGVDFSDHRNYWSFGYDAVMVTDTAFFRNPNYHRKTDTPDTLAFDKMAEVVKGVCWTILNMK